LRFGSFISAPYIVNHTHHHQEYECIYYYVEDGMMVYIGMPPLGAGAQQRQCSYAYHIEDGNDY
jgi:hypothetical protein